MVKVMCRHKQFLKLLRKSSAKTNSVANAKICGFVWTIASCCVGMNTFRLVVCFGVPTGDNYFFFFITSSESELR